MTCSLRISLLYVSTFLAFPAVAQKANDTLTQEIMAEMFASIKKVETLTYLLKNTERIGNQLLSGEQFIKYSNSPKRCYFYMISPDKGSELIFSEGENDNLVMYDPSGFPYVRMNLDPLGDVMRHYNHHTVYEAGFTYMGRMLEGAYHNNMAIFNYQKELTWEGNQVYLLIMDNPNYTHITYQARATESIRDIAEKFIVSEYKIYELNPKIRRFRPLKHDITLRIPNAYARKIELYVDKETYLPVYQKIYDEKGLFELYEYHDLSLNPDISKVDFEAMQLDR